MKQKYIIKAYEALTQITSQKFENTETAKQLYFLKKKLKDVYDFQREEEQKILDEHPNLNPVTMQIKMPENPTEEDLKRIYSEKKEIEAAFTKLAEQEHDLDIEPVKIDNSVEKIKFAPDDFENLEGFVEID